jgi:TPR repeat protein
VRAGAETGVAEAQAVLGQMMLDAGQAPEGFAWFNKAAAQGHLMALNMVGRCYDLGWGVAVDKARAAECFRIAAERGLEWGMYNYATSLTLGDGVAEDKVAALGWFEKAGRQGNAKALNYIGSFHEDGWVVAKDMQKAADFYARAAEGGDFRGAFNHARMLAGEGRFSEAREWVMRCFETATPAFAGKARAFLAASPWVELHEC